MLFLIAQSTVQSFSKELILTIVVTVICPFIVAWLRAKSDEAKAKAANEKMTRQQVLAERVKSFLLGTAANIAEKRFPVLAQQVAAGKITNQVAVKAELAKWGEDLKAQAQEHFSTQGVDIAREFADSTLDNWIERAANQVSPFPGMDTAKTILKDQVSNMIVDKGIEYAKVHLLVMQDGKLTPAK